MCLVDGVGLEQDRQSARQMLENSAKGQFEQDRFWTEETFALRFDKVIALFRTLEAHKQREAQYWLGICYEFGIGTDRDRDKSIELYYLSSKQGYEPARQVFSRVPENMQALIKKRLGD
jgi:TPR repeat protein